MKDFDIVCLGELAIDYISDTDKITDNPSSVILKSLKKFYGGMGGNFSVTASLFKSSIALIGYAGEDLEGRDYISYLKEKGIDTTNVLQAPWSSHSRCFIFNQKDKSRIFFYAGALIEEREKYMDYAKSLINKVNSKLIYCSSMDKELNNLYLKESKAKIKAFCPAHNTHTLSKADLNFSFENTDILILNSHECEIVEKVFEKSLFQIAKDFDMEVFIKTLGRDGCEVIIDGKPTAIQPCRAAREVDHTGAGDAFAGAFMANYIKTKDPIYSAKIGSATASFVVEEHGCQTGIPTLEKLNKRTKENYQITITK